jgi:hypothetical protein
MIKDIPEEAFAEFVHKIDDMIFEIAVTGVKEHGVSAPELVAVVIGRLHAMMSALSNQPDEDMLKILTTITESISINILHSTDETVVH